MKKEEKLIAKYIWLDSIDNMSYMLYLRLLKIFKTLENIYEISKTKNKFKEILIQNNVILSDKLISDLINFNLKEKSKKIYNNLKNQNISIVPIEDKMYNKKIKNMYNPPLCLFFYGDLLNLNKKCIYLHKEEFNNYGKYVYKNIYAYLIKQNLNLYNYNIFVKNVNLYDEKYILDSQLKQKQSKNKLYVLVNEKIEQELLVTLCDICIIPQAKYDEKNI